MPIIPLLVSLAEILLKSPIIRSAFEEVVVRIFAARVSQAKDDPILDQKLNDLGKKISDPTLTMEERSNALKQINSLTST
jgi:hypothetical protein